MSNIVNLVIYPDVRLKTRADEVTEFDDALRHNIFRMEKAIPVFNAWGLAGVQIGFMKRVIYINHDSIVAYENKINSKAHELRGSPLLMINPKILTDSGEKFTSKEGCVSLPGVDCEVQRLKYIKASYQDEFGKEHVIETEIPTLSACIQHEIDHINGITIAEHQSAFKRNMLIKKIEKYLKTRDHIAKIDLDKLCDDDSCSHEHHTL